MTATQTRTATEAKLDQAEYRRGQGYTVCPAYDEEWGHAYIVEAPDTSPVEVIVGGDDCGEVWVWTLKAGLSPYLSLDQMFGGDHVTSVDQIH